MLETLKPLLKLLLKDNGMATHVIILAKADKLAGRKRDAKVNYLLVPCLSHAHVYWVHKTFTPPSIVVNKLPHYIIAKLFFPH